MPKTDLGDVCGRYLSSRLSKQTNSLLSNNQQSIKHFLNHEYIATEPKRHTILKQKLFFKPYKKNPLNRLRQRYTIIHNNNNNNNNSENINTLIMPANNDVLLTAFNNNTTNGTTNGTNSNHQYCSTYMSCSNGSHSSSPPSETSSLSPSSSTSNSSSSLMMNWELLKDRGSGLVNLGNTCFINASLQCLANTPPLVQWLLCNSHFQCCRVKLEKQFCLFCEAERIVKLIHSKNLNSSFTSNVGAANPNNIVRRIKDISTTFKIGRQEDASEFLICLIDKIVDASLRSSQPPERLRPSSGTSYEQLCHSQTIFHDLFGLVLRSRVVCSRCRHTSDTFEVQYTWIVGVRNHTDLRQSLQQFVCRETLSGENLYRCIKCKQLVQAVKRYTLHKASKILLINLKRFEFGKNSHKLSHLVRYPEYLNVSPYMSEENSNDQSLNYRLYAVLVHVGSSMHSGHYFSYVRSPNNRWYKADDTTMTQCDLNQVLTQHGAYILCYIKETPLTNNTTNGSLTTTSTPPTNISATTTTSTSKIVYQNGKLNNSEQQTTTNNNTFFTPRQIPVQNLSKQTNGQNGNIKTVSSSLTKPTIVSSNTESTNGGSTLSTEKRAPIVMRIPKLNFLSNKPVPLHDKSITNPNSITPLSSKLVNKPNSNPIVLSTTKNSNYTISPTTSLSTVQSTSSPLKLIIKASGPSPTLNGLASISKSYNHYDDDDDDDDDEDNDDTSDLQQPSTKKQRIDDSETSPSISQHLLSSSIPITIQSSISMSISSEKKSIDEQSNNSSSSTTKHKKKRKKKKSHKHHHHHHHKNTHHHHNHYHHKRSRHDSDRSQSRSPVLSSPSQLNSSSPSLVTDDQYRRHRKRKKHHRHKRHNSSSTSPSLREPL
ncbi:unnamed protein product [Rotaria sp. Silwood2]|nr:unnamed protein product [Rotaria sp. Silwood2]CAF2672069.1 unnamed protein product [Rotaria sp. Silwood2]CAF4230867.1 unnamed protein product [Rotaria sp. Silwood2]